MSARESKFNIGDKVKYMTMIGKIVKVKYTDLLGFVYTVRYGLFNKKMAFESSLTPLCECCKNKHTMECPNSINCYGSDDKPFYKSNN